ncbi:hypothetical protein J6590_081605 [Homalodisca vitripennis]|nr:hypothetical protein J6590_081605 [Homalodisca vitripennis]
MSLYRPNPVPEHTSDRNSSHTPPKTGAVERKCTSLSPKMGITSAANSVSLGRLYPNPSCPSSYLCCKSIPSSQGSLTCRRHVWSGISTGMNGLLEGFVTTLPDRIPLQRTVQTSTPFTAVILLVDVFCLAGLSPGKLEPQSALAALCLFASGWAESRAIFAWSNLAL